MTNQVTNQVMNPNPQQPIAQFEIGKYQNFVYLILDWNQRKAAIVDPQLDLSLPFSYLEDHGFELVATLLTHTHFDHIAGVPELIREFPKLPIYVHAEEMHRFDPKIRNSGNFSPLKDNQEITIGKLRVRVMHTPGHSSGECSYFMETNPPYLFTGDTVFIRDCGRTDLPTGSNKQMFDSLQKIKALPKETVILPGHHYKPEYTSTIEVELAKSPPFQCRSVDELAALP